MATLAEVSASTTPSDDRFFVRSAFAMAITVVAGFSLQLAMGRSTFASPPLVHAHALFFMGWVMIYVLQNIFATSGNMALHRRLGWIGAGWIVAMVALGCAVSFAMARRGQIPFFFKPQHFIVFDPVTLLVFAGLVIAAIRLRRRTDWHRRLHFCAMALLLSPAFGRLLPLPLLIPWAFEATVAALMIFPVVGVWADIRRTGHIHPAWKWGIGAIIGSVVLSEAITYSPVGSAFYEIVTRGSPGANVSPLEFPPPPEGPLRTGRTVAN